MFEKAGSFYSKSNNKEDILNFIIESNKFSLKKRKRLNAVLYLENNGALELYFINNDSHETKLEFWDEVLDYIRANNITRLFMVGDYKKTNVETGEVTESLVVNYADSILNIEQYETPYKRKLFKGIIYGETKKNTEIDLPYLDSIFDYWENGDKFIKQGLKRYALPDNFKIYFPKKDWYSAVDPEDGHFIFYTENHGTIHLSMYTPIKDDGTRFSNEEFAKFTVLNEYRKKRDDLKFPNNFYSLNIYEDNESVENGKHFQILQCGIVYDNFLFQATIAAEDIKDCEQALKYFSTLTHKDAKK